MRRIMTAADQTEAINALHERYRMGEISETVYAVSLGFFMPPDDVRTAVRDNQIFFRNSLPFKQGKVT